MARWNEQAARGEDTDFDRGKSVHDRWWGDPAQGPGPAATLGPLDTPPFYAVQVYSGVLGTKGGPRTDGNGQVLDVDGQPIPGPVRRRKRHGLGHGHDLRRGRGNARASRSCSATWPAGTLRRRRGS